MRKCLLYKAAALLFCLHHSFIVRSQLQKIYLHPKAPGIQKQSEVIDSIHFIPLQTKKDVDLNGYNSLVVTDNYFLVNDYAGKTILLYNKEGVFCKKVIYRKLGENLSTGYDASSNRLVFFGDNNNYALTPKDRIKILLDWNNPRNKKYYRKYAMDLADTTFAIKKESPTENDVLGASAYGNNSYWRGKITTSPLYKDSLDYELKIYKNNQLQKAFFPYNRVNEPRFLYAEENIVWSNTNTPNVFVITRPFCDTVYTMTNDRLTAAYELVMPLENTLPASFYNRPFKSKTDRENFERNNGWMFQQVASFYETPHSIFFAVSYLTNDETYVYLKQTRTCYQTKNIKPDSSQYDLSLLDDDLQRVGDRFYKLQAAGNLVSFFENHKNVPVPKELATFLASKPASTSPVIVEFKFKD